MFYAVKIYIHGVSSDPNKGISHPCLLQQERVIGFNSKLKSSKPYRDYFPSWMWQVPGPVLYCSELKSSAVECSRSY